MFGSLYQRETRDAVCRLVLEVEWSGLFCHDSFGRVKKSGISVSYLGFPVFYNSLIVL